MDESPEFAASVSILDSDPLLGRQDEQIGFFEYRVHPEEIGNFWTSRLDAVGQAVLAICIFNEHACSLVGTATVVASGVAVTADHVVSEYRERIMARELQIFLLGFSRGKAIAWRLESVTPIPQTDLAILSLSLSSDLPPENLFEIPVISLRLPKIGERVSILGFREIDANVESTTLRTSSRLFHSIGLVTQHFLNGRGSTFPWAHIAIGCNTPGGVSGGAAYDKFGNLIGLLSTSMEHEDGEGPSFVSLMVPAVAQPFPVHWLTTQPGKWKTRLIDIEQGHCNFANRDSIRVSLDAQTGMSLLIYDDGT